MGSSAKASIVRKVLRAVADRCTVSHEVVLLNRIKYFLSVDGIPSQRVGYLEDLPIMQESPIKIEGEKAPPSTLPSYRISYRRGI